MNISLIIGILFVALIFLSMHFNFAEKALEWWGNAEDKLAKTAVILFYGLAVVAVIALAHYAIASFL